MKTTFVWTQRFAVALLLAGATNGLVNAQQKSEKANEVSVKIIERTGDNVRQIDRTYKDLSEAERDNIVKKLVDSLKTTHNDGRKRQMTIIIEDNDSSHGPKRLRGEALGQNRLYFYKGRPEGRKADADAWVWDNQNWKRDFNRGMDSLNDKLSRFEFRFPKDFDQHIIRPFDEWSKSLNTQTKASTIRGLEAFPNNPDRDQLNIRFTAPAKGNVTISVTNTKGKEIAHKEVKDFSGDYVGQIELDKKVQGVYFITVTQNEDGATKRVVID